MEKGTLVVNGRNLSGGGGVSQEEVNELIEDLNYYEQSGFLSRNINDQTLESGSVNPSTGENVVSTAHVRSVGRVKVKGNTTYTMSLSRPVTEIYVTLFREGVCLGTEAGQGGGFGFSQLTFETRENADEIRYWFRSQILDNKVQIEVGNERHPYTPYTPSNIELSEKVDGTIQDLNFYEQSGFLSRNLFNWDDVKKSYRIRDNGIFEDGNWCVAFVPIKPNEPITISGYISSSSSGGIGFADGNKNLIETKSSTTINGTYTSTNTNAKYFVASVVQNTTLASYSHDIQIEYGTEAHGYTSYAPSNFEISRINDDLKQFVEDGYLPNNLFYGNNIELGAFNNSTGAPTDYTKRIRTIDFIDVDASTEYILVGEFTQNINQIDVFFWNGNTFLSRTGFLNLVNGKATFTTPSNCNKIKIQFRNSTEVVMVLSDIIKCQIQKTPFTRSNVEITQDLTQFEADGYVAKRLIEISELSHNLYKYDTGADYTAGNYLGIRKKYPIKAGETVKLEIETTRTNPWLAITFYNASGTYLKYDGEYTRTLSVKAEQDGYFSFCIYSESINLNEIQSIKLYAPYIPSNTELEQSFNQLSNQICDDWTPRTYSKGVYVRYNGKIWKCLTTNNATPSESTNWSEVKVTDEFSYLMQPHTPTVTPNDNLTGGTITITKVLGKIYYLNLEGVKVATANSFLSVANLGINLVNANSALYRGSKTTPVGTISVSGNILYLTVMDTNDSYGGLFVLAR